MSFENSTDLKRLCDRAAEVLTSPGAHSCIQMLRMMGSFEPAERGNAASPAQGPKPRVRGASDGRSVGVWQESKDSSFLRSLEKKQEWAYWASVGRIPPKGARRRVVLLGESAARGFFYDPLFNLAKALELMLGYAAPGATEVIDLACTDQTLPELETTFESAFALAPDAIVIYAGNNWGNTRKNPTLPRSVKGRGLRSIALREQGVAGLKRMAESELACASTAFMERVAARCKDSRTPVLMLIPEYNLADWRDARPIAPWLSDDKNVLWLESCRIARAALSSGDLDVATAAAQNMVTLDEGVSAFGLALLGECARRGGRFDEARQFLERARDATVWDPLPQSPRGFAAVQGALRAAAAANNLGVVDLPQIFAAHLRGELPDRRLFIDYCHLSIEGIRVSMAHTAASLLPMLGLPSSQPSELAGVALPVTPAIEAQAHFAAAIHTAHWAFECEDVMRYHCDAALEKDPAVAASMRHYMQLMTRQAPVWMCEAADALAAGSTNPSLARYIIGTLPVQPKVLDRSLFDILAARLGCAGELENLRIEEHARSGACVSLLSPYLSLTAVGDREAIWLTCGSAWRWPSFFRSYSQQTQFLFVEDRATQGELTLTVRVPGDRGASARLRLAVNGHVLFDGDGSTTWRKLVIGVPSTCVHRGVNEVVITWPTLARPAREAVMHAAMDLECGRTPELYPVFGEVHSVFYG